MRTSFFAGALAGLALLAAGCAGTGPSGPETKLGRGINNITDLTHFGEFSYSMEQAAIYDGPDAGATAGFWHGLSRTLLRAGVGTYEVVTAPLPPYDPIIFPEWGAYPDAYKHGLFEDSLYSVDSNLGFSGGEIVPIVPGSHFHVFDN